MRASKEGADHAFEYRAARFHARKTKKHANIDEVVANALGDVSARSFEVFRKLIETTRAGIVFTAHPTFAMSKELRKTLTEYPSDEGGLDAWRGDLAKISHEPPADVSLLKEHEDAQNSIMRAQDAIAVVHQAILDLARKTFPERWTELVPNTTSLATWVGYDLDGRTDIAWYQTIRIRVGEKADQLQRYADAVDKIGALGGGDAATQLASELRDAADFAREQAMMFAEDLSNADLAVAAANKLTEDNPNRITNLNSVIETIDGVLAGADNDELRMACCLLRSEMRANGLGVARIHLRVNAAQVRSALRGDLGLDPANEFLGRSALSIAATKASESDRRPVNFASIFLEQMTARRQFMLCAQILKHIDEEAPIRFLIAECEAPATVMGAVYLARLYGVESKVDISPLFETPAAIETGGRFLERLLKEPEYCEYVKQRGRMAIQLGFSDAGRFIGQAPAALAIERLHVLFSRALAEAKLSGVEALVFNTHGESMGRGAHPVGDEERFDHLITPWARSRFALAQIHLNMEVSFQGGDGFAHFDTQELAQRTVNRFFRTVHRENSATMGDRFYEDINFSWDFHRGLMAWQQQLFDNPDYGALVGSFAENFLFKTGSRQVRRRAKQDGPASPRMMRAIPHNAILQQLGIPVNVAGGIGIAAGREPNRLADHIEASPRMQNLISYCHEARRLTDVSVLRGYAGIFDPSFWVQRAGLEQNEERASANYAVATQLGENEVYGAASRMANLFAVDLGKSDRICQNIACVGGGHPFTDEFKSIFGALHCVRQALMVYAVSLTASLPNFSARHDVYRSDLIDLALQLRIEELIELVAMIFPETSETPMAFDGLSEPGDEAEDHIGGYPQIHRDIVKPLKAIQLEMKRIGLGLAHFYGAFG